MLQHQAVQELGVQAFLAFEVYFSELAEAQLQATLPFDSALGVGTEKEVFVKVVVNDQVL